MTSKPPEGGSKTQNCSFQSEIALHLKKVCYKVSLCEYCQRQSRQEFTGLSIRAKRVRGPKLTHPLPKADFQSIFTRSASAV